MNIAHKYCPLIIQISLNQTCHHTTTRELSSSPLLTITMIRALRLSRLSLSKLQLPAASVSPRLLIPHGCLITRVAEIYPDHLAFRSSRKSPFGFRTFCTSEDLTSKKCVPCNAKDLQPMTEEVANSLMPKVDGWKLLNEEGLLKLNRSWTVKSFTKGLELFKRVAEVAEAKGHHPDLHLVGWNNVTIEIWTHAVGGITENDFILAAKINELDVHDLLRRKAKA